MYEKEIKILDIDFDRLQGRLKRLGAELIYKGPIYDIKFKNHNHKSNLKIRVRQTDEQSLLCFKSKVNLPNSDGIKIRKEREYPINWTETMETLIRDTNLKPHKTRFKYRTSYKIGMVSFDIDKYPSLPTMLEIEAPSKELIDHWIMKLGYCDHQHLQCGVKGLFSHYGHKKLMHYA